MHPIPNLSNGGKNERHVLSRHRLVTRPRVSWDFYTLLIGPMYTVPFFISTRFYLRGDIGPRCIIFMKLWSPLSNVHPLSNSAVREFECLLCFLVYCCAEMFQSC